jgi:UPF0716 protein FxsA
MLGVLLLAFLVVPIIELYVFVQVADAIGFLPTLLWIVAVSIIGAWLVKREGLSALRRANEKVAAGQVPTDELVGGILILVGGALLLTPGFFTDVLGLAMVLPPTRALLRGTVKRRFVAAGPIVVRRTTGFGGFGPPGARPGGEVWDAESWEDPTDGPDRPGLR